MAVYITAAPLLPGELPITSFGTMRAQAISVDRAIDEYLPNSPMRLRQLVSERVSKFDDVPEDAKLAIIAGLQNIHSVIELIVILASFDEAEFEAKIAGEGEVR